MDNKINIALTKFQEHNDIDNAVRKVCYVFEQAKKLKIFPVYNLSYSGPSATEFDISEVEIRKEVLKNWDKQFPNLGTRITKFYVLDNDYNNPKKTGQISVSSGSESDFSSNVTNIGICLEQLEKIDKTEIVKVFVSLINNQLPYYGYIESRDNYKKTNSSRINGEDKMPRTVQWVNYWSHPIIEKIGMKHIEKAGFYKIEKLDKGWLLMLQENPIDNENEEELGNQRKIIKHLSKYW